MFYLYARKGLLIGKFQNVIECHKATGFSITKLNDCVNTPGLVIGSCFASPYRWRNTKEDRAKFARNALEGLSEERINKIMKMLKSFDEGE